MLPYLLAIEAYFYFSCAFSHAAEITLARLPRSASRSISACRVTTSSRKTFSLRYASSLCWRSGSELIESEP
jgi:hypothetical protein